MGHSLTAVVSTAGLALSDAPSCVGTFHSSTVNGGKSLIETLSLGEK